MSMDWQKTYPAISTAMEASFETVCTWCDNLPAPQTDVERAVMRRLKMRRDELMAKQVRAESPEIADKWNEIVCRLDRAGIKSRIWRM